MTGSTPGSTKSWIAGARRMNFENEKKLFIRIAQAGDAALIRNGYVTAIDILVGVQWLQEKHVEDWRRGRLPYLERAAR